MAFKENVGAVAILLGIVYTCTLATANCGAQEKPISVVLKGKVVCDACSLDGIVSGAVVAVECSRGLNRKTSAGLVSIEGETNENGEFKLELPSSIISSVLLSSFSSDDHNPTLKGYCSVRLLSSPQEKCNVPFPITSSSDLLTLTSDFHGIRTFTFPSLSCCPQSKLCSHRDITGSSDHESLPTGRVLHEVSKGSSNGMDASLPHANFLPLPKPQLGFPHLPHPHLLPLPHPHLGFPPLHLPHPHLLPLPHPHLGFPPLHLPHPNHRPLLNFPPLPISIPYRAPTLSP